ncbi:MAG: amino acid adenylation domain-containing protein, partial [Acidobacteria bacterium]|nr:amino acid adenylation domain-containing protein [Acidobacteriota bacterium]
AGLLGRDNAQIERLCASISVEDNFFDLGGHSLKTMHLAARIHQEFNTNVSLTDIFKMPKLKDLAAYIKGKKNERCIALEPAEEKEYYELAPAQKRLYVLQHMNPDSIAYNMPAVIPLPGFPGSADLVKIVETFKKLIKRHESLRTSFFLLDGQPVQKIHQTVPFEIETVQPGPLKDVFNHFIRPFDLSRAPLLRVGMVMMNPGGRNILLLDIHHIISDGLSQNLLAGDFQALYGQELPPLRIQYKDFSEWQNSNPAELPFALDANEVTALKNLAATVEATLFMVLLAMYKILLARLGASEDIIVGIPVAGRRHSDLEKIIGMFVNTLALRNYPVGEKTFPVFLKEIKERTLAAFENQDYPFEELVDQLQIVRDVSRNPLFDVMFNYMVADAGKGREAAPDETKKQESQENFNNSIAKFDLTLTGVENDGKIFFLFQYAVKLFKEETIQRFSVYFKKIAAMVVKEPGIRIQHIEIISGEEKKQILFDFNDTAAEYPKDKTIHQLFAEQAAQTPDAVALVARETREKHEKKALHITYFQLNKQSGCLAGLLIEKGVLPGSIVGIMMERSVEMIACILGILKSGGAYLALDPAYPKSRIDYMLKDSATRVLLTNDEKGKTNNCQLAMRCGLQHSNLAYVIYTSGSTGNPKGVLVEHRNVIRLVKNAGFIHYTNRDRLLPTGSVAFDISTFEIWSPLLNGVTLCLAAKEVFLNAEALTSTLVKYGISVLHLIPQLFNQMAVQKIEMFAGLRYFLVGGDLVKPGLINLLRRTYPRLKIIHCYGPTENTTFSTTFMVENDYDVRIPIGKPIGNSSAFIVNRYNHVQPVGVPGELCVGGEGIAQGYLNNPELTCKKFKIINYKLKIKNGSGTLRADLNAFGDEENFQHSAFSIQHSNLYFTGDFARWLPGGAIEFLGRIDHQVKIRGFRVELEEIENCLLKLDKIKEAVVLSREEEGGDKYLCAYFFSEKAYEVSELREYMAQELPDYMIPSYFVRMEAFPLTANGKIDKKALPAPKGLYLKENTAYALPSNSIEKKLVEIWEKVLGRNPIGIHENFFMIGGDSIKSIQ